ncbi:hypothetical protein LLEC1_02491 [Akanthomyces lecanii]|uniref:AMP-dependent synthetase/ligase domain-containing protein n=1 Tax=Cordyceps confragosa TaxID=2714763 RepID=A0A179IQK4_CORDF|nr:hypothetical protein LLEC1_02491 [Akanthomyces lecanii]
MAVTTMPDLISPSDEAQISKWNSPVCQPIDGLAHSLFEQHAKEQGSAPAVCSWDGNLTYAELDNLSSNLAQHLNNAGVGRGTIVPLCFQHSKWMLVAMLAVNKAGGAWLPLEPFQEGDINAKIIVAVKPRLILCSKLYEKLPMTLSSYSGASMVVDTHTTAQGVATATNGTATTPHVTGADPAYIFFTSGSTGEPKGCINTHSAYLAALKSHQVSLAMTPNSRAMHNTSYCFDAFLIQTMLPLSAGACVCIPAEEAWKKNPTACLAEFGVTWAFFVPWFLVQIDKSQLPSLKTVIIGVEGISQPQMTKWSQQVQLIHGYGLSECCVVSHVASRMSPSSDPRNVGVPGSFFHWIVDPNNHERLMPVGEVGELLLSGPSLGGGYLYQEQASKEAYIESPSWLPEAHRQTWPRLFKTQDLARYAPDGSLVIIGRKNTLTNFNGHQIIMPELEHFMQRVILSAALLVVERTQLPALGSDTLVCFVGLGKSADGLMQQLNAADCTSITHMIRGLSSKSIQAALPSSITCTPSVFIPVSPMPRKWSGKTHRPLLIEAARRLSRDQLLAYEQAWSNAQPFEARQNSSDAFILHPSNA